MNSCERAFALKYLASININIRYIALELSLYL